MALVAAAAVQAEKVEPAVKAAAAIHPVFVLEAGQALVAALTVFPLMKKN
jgi:hypothetical protein